MRSLIILLTIALCVGQSSELYSQRDRRAQKETKASMQDQAERKAAREAEFEKNMSERQERHMQAQTKATRKRMKENRKRSERMNRKGTHLPFYKRWFRKRHFR